MTISRQQNNIYHHSIDDHCRVVLTQQGQKPGSDYVNGSFVDVSALAYLLTPVRYYECLGL